MTTSPATTPIWRRSSQPPVINLLQEYLISQGYQPGDQLPTEAKFSAEMQVSRNAIREALRALEALGIVEVRHGSGSYLRHGDSTGLTTTLTFWSRLRAEDDMATLRMIAEVRDAMESSLVVKLIGLHDAAQLAELEQHVAAMEERASHHQAAPDADRKFHQLLFEPLGNWVLDHVLDSFWDTYLRVGANALPPPDLDAIAQQHRAILEALKSGDAERLSAHMAQHFDNALAR